MKGSEHSLVPQRHWLKNNRSLTQLTSPPHSDHISYSGRSWQGRDWEKDIDRLFHKDKLFLGRCDNDNSDYVNKILSNMFEKDQLQRSKSMNSGRWREALFHRTSGDVSNLQTNHERTNGRVTGVVGRMYKSVLDEEFPSLGAEDKYGTSQLERRLSSGSITSSHGLLTDTLAVIVRNGLTSASHQIPATVGKTSHQPNDSASTSTSPRTMALSMAESLAQRSLNSHTPPRLSVSSQKLEELALKQSRELALKQSRLLIPVTPSTPRSLAASSSEKSKLKSRQVQYPFLHSHSPSHSLHGAHPNLHIQKIISSNSHDVITSRELNGISLAAKDNLSPNGGRVVLSPVSTTASTPIFSPSKSARNSTPSAWITLEKRPTFQTQSRSAFLKNLSRKSSSEKPSDDVFSIGISCALEKCETNTRNDISCLSLNSRDGPSVDTSVMNSLNENNSIIITRNGNDQGEPSKFSNNGEQQCSTNQGLYSEEEEIAFLRSLGWEESVGGDDEGLTEEEIRDFYEKYAEFQTGSNIPQIAHQSRIALPLRNVVEPYRA